MDWIKLDSVQVAMDLWLEAGWPRYALASRLEDAHALGEASTASIHIEKTVGDASGQGKSIGIRNIEAADRFYNQKRKIGVVWYRLQKEFFQFERQVWLRVFHLTFGSTLRYRSHSGFPGQKSPKTQLRLLYLSPGHGELPRSLPIHFHSPHQTTRHQTQIVIDSRGNQVG